jgi:hypothetical protein
LKKARKSHSSFAGSAFRGYQQVAHGRCTTKVLS